MASGQVGPCCHKAIAHEAVVPDCKSCCCCTQEEALLDPLAGLALGRHLAVVHLVHHRSILVEVVLACLLLARILLPLARPTDRLGVALLGP
jgi:hypothetical protein